MAPTCSKNPQLACCLGMAWQFQDLKCSYPLYFAFRHSEVRFVFISALINFATRSPFYNLIVIHLVCLLEAFSLVDGGTYHLTVAIYRMLIGWQMIFFGHD